MLKYVVVAVFSICALPCFATAQSGSRATAPVLATPMVDGGAQYDMGAPVEMGAPMEMGAPSYDMGAPMEMGVSSDCGCGEPVADCGCGAPEPSCCAPRTRKKLSFAMVPKEVCRMKRVCSTDCCGCPTSKLVREMKTVSRPKLSLVDAPARERCCCAGGRLKGLLSKLGSCGCKAQADDCGCSAPAPVADCGCGEAAPVADCGCGS